MLFIHKSVHLLFATVVMLTLTACGSAPSEDDIKAAIAKSTEAETKAMQKFGGKQASAMSNNYMPQIKSVKKIGCKEDGEKAYKCDVEVEVSQMGATHKGIAPMRFVKGSDGWIASK